MSEGDSFTPSGETARGVLVFFGDCSGVGGDCFTPAGEDGTRGLVPGYVPPQERTARGGWFFVFSLGIAPVSVCVLTTGVVIRRRAVSGETARGGFGLGDCFTPSGVTRGGLMRFGEFLFFEGGALLRIIFQCPPSPENPPLSPVPPAESGWAYCAHWPPKDAPL